MAIQELFNSSVHLIDERVKSCDGVRSTVRSIYDHSKVILWAVCTNC